MFTIVFQWFLPGRQVAESPRPRPFKPNRPRIFRQQFTSFEKKNTVTHGAPGSQFICAPYNIHSYTHSINTFSRRIPWAPLLFFIFAIRSVEGCAEEWTRGRLKVARATIWALPHPTWTTPHLSLSYAYAAPYRVTPAAPYWVRRTLPYRTELGYNVVFGDPGSFWWIFFCNKDTQYNFIVSDGTVPTCPSN